MFYYVRNHDHLMSRYMDISYEIEVWTIATDITKISRTIERRFTSI